MKRFGIWIGIYLLFVGTATAKIMPKFVPAETRIYHFEDQTLQALEQCSAYKSTFSIKDTPYAHFGDFAGNTEVVPEFEIYGMKKGLCLMRVRFSAFGKGETRFNCKLDDTQRQLLLKSMRDKSTEKYVITLPLQSEQKCDGCNESVMFLGNTFDVTVDMLKSRVCIEQHIQPTSAEIKSEHMSAKRFSPAFLVALEKCETSTETLKSATQQDEVRIIGLTNDGKCRLQYADFDLAVNKRDLKNVTDYRDLQQLLSNNLDDAKYLYEQKYDATGLLFALAECRDKNGTYAADENVYQRGNIQARTGLNSYRDRNVCRIELKNTLMVGDVYYRDYSLECAVSDAFWPNFLKHYQHLLDSFGVIEKTDKNGILHRMRGKYTAETSATDADLFKRLRSGGFCVPKQPKDITESEVERFLYRDSPLNK